MSGERPVVSVGDVLRLGGEDYLHGAGPFEYGRSELRLRVKHVSRNWRILAKDWIPLIGMEILPGGADGPDRALIVRRSAFPGCREVIGG